MILKNSNIRVTFWKSCMISQFMKLVHTGDLLFQGYLLLLIWFQNVLLSPYISWMFSDTFFRIICLILRNRLLELWTLFFGYILPRLHQWNVCLLLELMLQIVGSSNLPGDMENAPTIYETIDIQSAFGEWKWIPKKSSNRELDFW